MREVLKLEKSIKLDKKDSIFRRHFWLFVLLTMFTVVSLCKVVPKVYAFSDWHQVDNSFNAFIEGFRETVFSKMTEAYKTFEEFMNPRSGDAKFNLSFVKVIEALAQSMVILYMLLNMIQEAQKGDPSLDYWTKIFLRTAIAMIVIISISSIMENLYKLGGYLIDQAGTIVTGASDTGGGDRAAWINALSKLPGLEDIGDVLGGAAGEVPKDPINWYKLQHAGDIIKVLNYIVWFPMAVCVFLMFSAIFEIKIRQLFAPLAVAAISYEGARGSGVRYLKKYFGCFLKIVIYFGIAGIGSLLTIHFLKEVDKGNMYVILTLLSNVVAGLSMMQSAGLGDEIIGA